MTRELSDGAVRIQAEQYISYESRSQDVDRETTFQHWAESKDFSPADRAAICDALEAMGVKVRRAA